MQRHQIRGIGVTRRLTVETTGEVERREVLSRLRRLVEHGDRSGKLSGAAARRIVDALEAELGKPEWTG